MFENNFFDFDSENQTDEEKLEQLKRICFAQGSEFIAPNRTQQSKLFNLALYLEMLVDDLGGDVAVIMPSFMGYHGTVMMRIPKIKFESNEEIVRFLKQISCCREICFEVGVQNEVKIKFEVPFVFNKRRSK